MVDCNVEQLDGPFPGRSSEIAQLYDESEDFREMCRDYAEVSCLLAAWLAPPDSCRDAVQAYQTLLGSLENEIEEALGSRFPGERPAGASAADDPLR